MITFEEFVEKLDEVSPPDESIERWIKHVKPYFKKEYGNDYKQVLYAKAWKLYKSGAHPKVDKI